MITAKRVYQMLGNETLWETAVRCDQILKSAGVSYSICGGVAVCMHGYQRNTVGPDLIVRPTDSVRIREAMGTAGFEWDPSLVEFRTPNGSRFSF